LDNAYGEKKAINIDIKLHFVRNENVSGSAKVIKVSTDQNSCNMITKVLSCNKFFNYLHLVQLIGDYAYNKLNEM